MPTTTPYMIAKKLQKPAQVVYKKISVLLEKPPFENIDEHIKKVNDKWIIDEKGEEIITSSFKDEQQSIIIEHKSEQFYEHQCSQMNNEIIELKAQLKIANDELIKEREFSRTQGEKLTEMTDRVISQNEQLIKLNENQQILLLSEQTKNKPPLLSEITTDIEEAPHENKQGFFKRIFKKKNR